MFILLILQYLILIILITVCLLIIIAFYTVTERKIMAAIQRRQGPHRIGILGLLQAFADALKLLLIPLKSGKIIFIFAP
jgi:NADH-quinone oxidoreductase subunit H